MPVAVCPSVRPSSSLLLLQCCLLLVTSATSSTITSSARRSIDIIDCVVPTTSTVSSRQAGRSAGRQGSQVTTHSGAQVSRVHWRAVVQGDVPIHPHPLLSLTDPACSFPWKTRADRPDLPCTRASSHPLSDDPSPTDTDRHVSVVNVCQYIYVKGSGHRYLMPAIMPRSVSLQLKLLADSTHDPYSYRTCMHRQGMHECFFFL